MTYALRILLNQPWGCGKPWSQKDTTHETRRTHERSHNRIAATVTVP
ncbi:hypothetical protein ACFVYR_03440 [Streptomyces sp. NPDC058284]